MVAVVFDTSVIRGTGWQSAPLRSLLSMAADKTIHLYVPDIVFHELRTQWRDDYEKKLTSAKKALRSLQQTALVPNSEKIILAAIDAEMQNTTGSDELSTIAFEKFCSENKIRRLPTTSDQSSRAWAAYFKGEPPFGNVKQRKDLPDAHIFESIKDLKSKTDNLLILCADGLLSKACASLPQAIIFNQIEEILSYPAILDAQRETKISKHWETERHRLIPQIDDEVTDYVKSNIEVILAGASVRDQAIPSDNHDADISMYDDAENIIIAQYNEFARGFYSYTVTFTSECLIDFQISKWDAYDAPDWISVSYGDPEEDHYFLAEGHKQVEVTLELTLEIDLRENYQDGSPILRDIQINGKPNICLA